MKTYTKTLLAIVATFALALPAQADWGRHHDHHRYERHHHHNNSWNTAAAAVAIAGIVGATAYYTSPPPATVVAVPQAYVPPAPAPAPRAWYYCASAGQYYPYARFCPEGWQAVAPQPRW